MSRLAAKTSPNKTLRNKTSPRKTSPAKAASIKLLKVDGIHAPVEIRRHPTARRLTLRVSRTQRSVVLTIPRNSDFREADRFLARSLDWVRERLEGVPEPVAFAAGEMIPLRGVPHAIVFAGPASRRAIVETVAGFGMRPPRLVVTGPLEHAPRRLKDWLVAEASRDLDGRGMPFPRATSPRIGRTVCPELVPRGAQESPEPDHLWPTPGGARSPGPSSTIPTAPTRRGRARTRASCRLCSELTS